MKRIDEGETRDESSELTEPFVAQELELGQHTLFIYEDNSIDLMNLELQGPSLAENVMKLDADETYRLAVSLQVWFEQGNQASLVEACTVAH
jgi:hypothetical protein